jgi:hypothetical protein
MAEKTLKVDEAVHNRLEELKGKYGVDTFNGVLRHELGLVADPDVEKLASFLHKELQELAEEVVEVINDIGEFEERVTERRNRQVLEFLSKNSDNLIATIEFSERYFQVRYRSQDGEMKCCGKGWYSSRSEGPSYGRIKETSEHTGAEDVVEQVEMKVGGAYQRWGLDS